MAHLDEPAAGSSAVSGMSLNEGYSTYFVCLCVCPTVPSLLSALKSSLYDKMDLPACFSLVFLDFQLIDLSKMPLFPRKSTFHVLYSSHVEHVHSI